MRIGQASSWALQGDLVSVTRPAPETALTPTLSQGERVQDARASGHSQGEPETGGGVIPLRLAAS